MPETPETGPAGDLVLFLCKVSGMHKTLSDERERGRERESERERERDRQTD